MDLGFFAGVSAAEMAPSIELPEGYGIPVDLQASYKLYRIQVQKVLTEVGVFALGMGNTGTLCNLC